ncbi:PilW family protein [Methylomonas rhizoryzae]|uniref:PilW family protein n=1 Tax=Methylomonas rhizoryzae TaxID=2608981 RepID=UPI001231D8F4|nr:PilW family protein [Methylomonas rhizoryzae]
MNKTYVPNSPQAGFSLIELMIAMMLGLFLIGGVVSVFLSNRAVYRQNENLSRMQESARYAFEVIARDLREAGGIPCGSNLPTANVLLGAGTTWWANWGEGLHGYEGTEVLPAKAIGTSTASRVSGTDAVAILSGTAFNGTTVTDHNPTAAEFKVNTTEHEIVDGDVILVCDFKQAAIFQTTNANSSNVTIVHNTGGSQSPGNCSKGLGVKPDLSTDCSSTNGTSYSFEDGGILTKLSSNAWYIGYNSRGGKSLYKVKMFNSGGNAITQADEVAEGITDMQLQYLAKDASGNLASDYVDATSITDWKLVVAIRLVFTLQSLENVATGAAQPLTRTWNATITVRNRQS